MDTPCVLASLGARDPGSGQRHRAHHWCVELLPGEEEREHGEREDDDDDHSHGQRDAGEREHRRAVFAPGLRLVGEIFERFRHGSQLPHTGLIGNA